MNWPQMGTAEHEALCFALEAQGQRVLRQEELVQFHQKVEETSKHSDSACDSLLAQLNFVIGQIGDLERPTQHQDLPTASGSTMYRQYHQAPLQSVSQIQRCFQESWGLPFLSSVSSTEFQAATFHSDSAKIAYIISYLSEVWATSEWSCKTAVCNSLLFHSTIWHREAAKELHALGQGR